MGVIGHRIDRNQFLPFSCDNSGDVLLQIFAMLRANHARATRDGEDNVQINLRVGVGHLAKPYMTLLAELVTRSFGGYKHAAPTALRALLALRLIVRSEFGKGCS